MKIEDFSFCVIRKNIADELFKSLWIKLCAKCRNVNVETIAMGFLSIPRTKALFKRTFEPTVNIHYASSYQLLSSGKQT